MGAACVAVVAAVVAWRCGVGPAELRGAWVALEHWLAAHPVWLVVALAVLPGLPLPSSALLVAAGVVWREHPLAGCAAAVGAMAVCQVWTYGFAAGPGRWLVARMIEDGGFGLPVVRAENHVRLVLILRLTPGMPFFVQNFALGLLHVPLRVYLPVSLLCNAPWVCGLVLTGAGLGGGNLLPLLGGVSLIVFALVLTHALRLWLSRRKSASARE
ncbi:MAG: VTT domain-containing protein [Akkermansiaceae bacterium]|nr:VTT domain-containing protein [Akkermansiaceae bacterium]